MNETMLTVLGFRLVDQEMINQPLYCAGESGTLLSGTWLLRGGRGEETTGRIWKLQSSGEKVFRLQIYSMALLNLEQVLNFVILLSKSAAKYH